ncbi:MAG: hypothetical protein IK081_00050 [Lachnospiraceae bacterium]|nr:hypothetical protein [Lachnospiraceae bacterium]
MSEYELGQDELVIIQDSNVRHNGTVVTLILTNQNIIQINTAGLFGKKKIVTKYPLIDLKGENGKANVLIGKAPGGETRLELYFVNHEKYYDFSGLFAEKKWANAIEKAYKDCWIEKKKSEKSQSPSVSLFSLNKTKNLKDSTEESRKYVKGKKKMMKCPKCGAELIGEKGIEVQCEYCDAKVLIK